MNRSERATLAQFAANLIYGPQADSERASIGRHLLDSFPSAHELYQYAAEVEAEDRIAGILVQLAGKRLPADSTREEDANFSRMYKTLESVTDMLSMYCEHSGVAATRMVDEGHEIDELMRTEAFIETAKTAAMRDTNLKLFLDAITA
jgi:hypothetical protein